MKKALPFLLLILGVAASAWAPGMPWQKKPGHSGYKDPVVVKAIGFNAIYINGQVVMTWKKYKRPDFLYYKVVKSATNRNPVYPDDSYVYVGDHPDKTRCVDENVESGTWYYRVCVITKNKDRWVSPVVTITVDASEGQGAEPSDKDFE